MPAEALTSRECLDRLNQGDISARELTRHCLDNIQSRDSEIRAFLAVSSENALKQAAAIDEKRAKGGPLGKLAGLPVAVKDNICINGEKTTCASKMLANFVSPYDAYVTRKLLAEDAVIIGKTNLDEFAMGSSTENSAFQQTRNPWNTDCVPGGSSGGSAAAVAGNMAPLALGSDTGGSIRQPASFCGVVGFKPTYGRVSRYGLVAFASSLDQIGPFSQDVFGAALLLEAIAGHDDHDSTSLPDPVPQYTKTLEQPVESLRIGFIEYDDQGAEDEQVRQAVQNVKGIYESLGATVEPVELENAKYGVATYYVIAPSEASSNLSRYDGVHYGHRATDVENLEELYAKSRGEGFGPEVKRRIMLGTYALSSGYADQYYNQALKVRRLIRRDYDAAFAKYDVLLSPVTPGPAFRIGELVDDPLQMYLTDMHTIGANLAGIPAISVPCGLSADGLPLGFQLLGPALAEEKLLRVARMFEARQDWKMNQL